MKQETKTKIKVGLKKFGKALWDWSPVILITSTITAAWTGCVNSARNEREVDVLKRENEEMRSRISEAETQIESFELELMERNEQLLEEAEVTEEEVETP